MLGGAVALGGAAAVGAFEDTASTTVVEQQASASPSTVPAAAGGALTVNEIYKRSGPGVVQITSTLGFEPVERRSSSPRRRRAPASCSTRKVTS